MFFFVFFELLRTKNNNNVFFLCSLSYSEQKIIIIKIKIGTRSVLVFFLKHKTVTNQPTAITSNTIQT